MQKTQFSDLYIPAGCISVGVAVLSSVDGRVLEANASAAALFWRSIGGLGARGAVHLPSKASLAEVLQAVRAGKSWSGRVAPLKNRHGISSIELMIHQNPKDPDRLWLYTLEHPSVNGAVRVSSRSELKLLQVLLDNTLEYVFFRDASGCLILTNRSFDRRGGTPWIDGRSAH